jgi:hypothetical protein
MSATTTLTTPAEVDTALAEAHRDLAVIEDRLGLLALSALRQAGANFYYRGRRRVTDMKLDEAETILASELEKLAAWKASNSSIGTDGWVTTDWVGYRGVVPTYDRENVERTVSGLAEKRAERAEVVEKIEELNALYTGWSRFFLVTSSVGHIHSSMCCSTCRPTTTYGWLPSLSGKSEEEAVEAHGPALCSVCFPSAPVEWVGGKITKAQAAKAAA